jgi:hypothetical protein
VISFGEFPFQPDLFVVASGTKLHRIDFDAIRGSTETRWRGTLKTASGLFRGVMMFTLAIIALSLALMGCTANGGTLRQDMQSRAAVNVEQDFSQDLDGWYGARNWAKTWLRVPAEGYAVVGRLALHRPSQEYADYRLEFFSQVGSHGIGWVYRAADLQNYYATELVVTKPGLMPTMALIRYRVIAGQETEHVQVPVRVMLHNGRPYRIQQNVVQQGFTTLIDDQLVDTWSDDRLRSGGVGFFAKKGDKPHIYWMRLTSHNDFLGKLFAAVAPIK